MAADKKWSEEEEAKIPVFTVFKNGSILKNIFINNPPSESESSKESAENGQKSSQEEEKLLVGRHPDCQIVLDHPSISRFHLQILLQPKLQKLSVIDLSSVHGTWVSGQKIEPQVPVELAEGDTLKFGASTRVYRLNWFSIGDAFEIENLLMPSAATIDARDQTYQFEQDENSTPVKNRNDSRAARILSAATMPEAMDSSFPAEVLFGTDNTGTPVEGGQNPTVEEVYFATERSLEREKSSKTTGRVEEIDSQSFLPPVEVLSASEAQPEEENQSMEAPFIEELPAEGEQNSMMEVAYFATQTLSDKENPNSLERRMDMAGLNHFHTPVFEEGVLFAELPGDEGNAIMEEDYFATDTHLDKENLSPPGRRFEHLDELNHCDEPTITELVNIFDTDAQLDTENKGPKGFAIKGALSERENQSPTRTKSEQQGSSPHSPKEHHFNVSSVAEAHVTGELPDREVFPPTVEEACFAPQTPLDKENQCPQRGILDHLDEENHCDESAMAESVVSTLPVEFAFISEAQLDMENKGPEGFAINGELSGRENPSSPRRESVEEELSQCSPKEYHLKPSSLAEDLVSAGAQNPTMKEAYSTTQTLLDKENRSPQRKRFEHLDEVNHCDELTCAESVNSSLPVKYLFPAAAQLKTENQSPEGFITEGVLCERENQSSPKRASEQHDIGSLWSRRHKPSSFLRIRTGRSSEKTGKNSDAQRRVQNQQENAGIHLGGYREEKLHKVLFSGSDGEEQSFPSDKENLTPQSLSLKSKKNRPGTVKLELHKSSLNLMASSDIEEDMFHSDKENSTPKVSLHSKAKKTVSRSHARFTCEAGDERKAERMPFQTLPLNSISNSKPISVTHATSKSSNSVNRTLPVNKSNATSANQSVDQTGHTKRKWNMVVDTSCLLDAESRRSLKLLEGLRGTHLIIPQMVIRELDCLKRRGSWFKKENDASSVLQWIEECMVKTSWWIHVQNSTERMPIAPTPPASPRSRLSEGSNEFPGGTAYSMPFSARGNFMEIVSPTAADHILECALLFKKIRSDGQLVLLTHDIALKIKAMSEALICETATEFRESLVNPYSDRFLWVESTPRGATWSCLDEAGLKENHRCTTRKTTKVADNAKGLKLILLHNSHYGHLNSVR